MHDRNDSSWAGLHDPIGLCATCRYVRIVPSARGSTFYLCRRSEFDPRFAKYPRLPVVRCVGYEPAEKSEGDAASPPKPGMAS